MEWLEMYPMHLFVSILRLFHMPHWAAATFGKEKRHSLWNFIKIK